MMRKLRFLTVCFLALTPKNVLSMNARFTFNRPSSETLLRQIRGMNTDTTLALPAIDVITYCALKLKSAKQELKDNPNALHDACQKNDVNKVKLLLAAGASADTRSVNDDWTPLHYAARWNNKEMAELLLRHHAPYNAQAHSSATPLHIALLYGSYEVARLLFNCNSRFWIESNFQQKETTISLWREMSLLPSKNSTLQELCLNSLLANFDDFEEDSLKEYIIPELINYLDAHSQCIPILVNQAPLALQQAIFQYWMLNKCEKNNNKIKLLLESHLEFYLPHILGI